MLFTPKMPHTDYTASDIAEMLDNTQWGTEFSWDQILVLGDYFVPDIIKAGDIIFTEDEPGDSMSIIVSGCVEITRDHKVLSTLHAGRAYGEMSLIDSERRSATAIAKEECLLLSIDKMGFDQLSEEEPVLALQLIMKITRLLSLRLRKTSSELCDILDENAHMSE